MSEKKEKQITAEDISKEFDHLLKVIEEKEYGKFVYPIDSKVDLGGVTFAKIVAANHFQRQILATLENLINQVSDALDYNDQVTLDLMRKHVENCENGVAKKQEEK